MRISPKRWIYWGIEDEIYKNFDPLEPFFFIEDGHPYRIGNGWRFKESPFTAFHIGLAKVTKISNPEGVLGGKKLSDISPEQIGKWGSDEVVQEEAANA